MRDRNNIPDLIRTIQSAVKEQALREIGSEGERALKLTIINSRPEWPPLQPETIAQKKGGSNPLVDTGQLAASITHKVEEDTVKIGIFGSESTEERTGSQNVIIGLVHEFGAPTKNIPARPWMRPTAEEKIFPFAQDKIAQVLNRAIDKYTF